MLISEKEVDSSLVCDTRIFHFGSVSMTCEPSRGATLHAVKIAREKGITISFDPNLRPQLWNDLNEAKQIIEVGLKYTDILKVSEEELEFITGLDDLEAGSEYILKKYGIKMILVTLGAKGCFYRAGIQTGSLPTYNVKTVDTTGAGDAFLGAFLYKVIENKKPFMNLSRAEVEQMIDFANAAGSISTTKKGAIPAMPTVEEIERCMKSVNKIV